MFNPFNWLRAAARNAILGGVADAFTELQAAAGDPTKPVSLADLQTKLQLTAPPTAETEPEEEPEPIAKKGTKR